MADEDPKPTPKSAEDRKAASALASLDASEPASTSSASQVDQDSLSKAMKGLSTGPGASSTSSSSAAAAGANANVAAAAASKVPKKVVKVDPADVALLVDQLELVKAKAIELLKAHDGDAVKAMRAWISA